MHTIVMIVKLLDVARKNNVYLLRNTIELHNENSIHAQLSQC